MAFVALLLFGCSNDPSSSPTDTPPQIATSQASVGQLAADLFAAYSAAWASGGPDAAAVFTDEHNHPQLDYTVEQYRAVLEDAEGYTESIVCGPESATPDPTYTFTAGSNEGQVPQGVVYTVECDRTTGIEGNRETERIPGIHVALIGDEVFFFSYVQG